MYTRKLRMISRLKFFITASILLHFCIVSPLTAQEKAEEDKKVGLVLAGGGALGLAHVGVLEYLEELNIPIDRIGGTSMGGIISGLYALGYDAEALKEVALNSDWDHLLSNDFDRRKAPLMTKNHQERYLLSLGRSKKQIGFSSAFIDGINIYQLLQRLTFPTQVNSNFENLSIPFYCVAVDLNEGKEVVQDSGHLPDALLSTMTIPAVFNPVQRDSFLLVDGGVLNNFPVKEIRRRGADLVIGVKLITARDERDYPGPFEVLGRTYEIVTEEARKNFEGDCDICIEVPLQDYSVADFNKADSLVAIGRRAAEKYKDQLMPLGESTREASRPRPLQLSGVRKMQLRLKSIEVEGNEHVPNRFILNTLKLKTGRTYEFGQIQEGIERLQASQHFKSIFYSFHQEGDEGTIMRLKVREKVRASLNIGIHYNSDFGLGLLLHPQFRNWGGFGNDIDMELRVSPNPYLQFQFMSNSNGVFSPFVTAKMEGEDYFTYNTDTDFDAIQNNEIQVQLGLQWNPALSFALGGGLEWEYYGFTDKAQQLIFDNLDTRLYNYFAYAEADFLDQVHFPTKGFEARFLYKRITDDLSTYNGGAAPVWLSVDYKHFFPITPRLIASVSGQLGYSSDFIDTQYLFYQGGMYHYRRRNSMVQAGMPLMRYQDENILAFQAQVRWNYIPFHHITAGYSNSVISEEFDRLLSTPFTQGVYLGYSYSSFVGPIELMISSPADRADLFLYFRIGYKF